MLKYSFMENILWKYASFIVYNFVSFITTTKIKEK